MKSHSLLLGDTTRPTFRSSISAKDPSVFLVHLRYIKHDKEAAGSNDLTLFQKSLELDPNHPQTLQNLTVAYTKKGDAARANQTLTTLEVLDPSNESIAKLREDIQKFGKK